MNKIYIVYEVEEHHNWQNDNYDKEFIDIFYVSSPEKAKEFLQKAIAEKYYELTLTTKIMIRGSCIDRLDDNFNIFFEGKISKFLKLKV